MSKSDKSTKTGEHFKPAKPQGPHKTGKANDPRASRRDDHPGKKDGRAEHQALIDDQRIDGRVVGTLGSESFPKHSTAARKEYKAVEAQTKSKKK